MTVAELFLKCLEEEGVEYIFGVPGEENLAFMDAVLESDIQFITTRHETGAAFMAGMMGRLTGKPGVCLSTLGPGATNMLTGVADANMDRSPLVAITAQAGMNRQHKESHQTYNLVELYRPVTKWNASIRSREITPEVVRKAFSIATDEKPGATHIELPEDIAGMEVDVSPLDTTYEKPHTTEAKEETIARAAEIINQAKKPLILCGNGITRDYATKEIQKFAEKIQTPVTETFMGKGAVPLESPLWLMTAGVPGRDWINCGFDYADLIITVGFDIAEYPPAKWNQSHTPILHIDTKEAETDAHYTVRLNVVGDLSTNLNRLTESVDQREKIDPYYEDLGEKMRSDSEEYQTDNSYPVKPQRIISDLQSVLSKEDIVLSDVGAHKVWMGRMYHADKPNTCLISNGLASMGYALPGAIAAKMVHPEKKVVAVVGDGAIQMTGMELETAVRLNLPIVILLWRDGGYGLIEWKQNTEYGRPSNIRFGNPDFVALAKAYGAEGFHVEETQDLVPTLEKALKLNKPVLIDCPVDYSENMKLTERLNKIEC
ncbi:MAG TPA: acetolactate synthase large subunit [Bacillales bacterium]|nr:acetolactate synthase large subunit [Bacillales bacterium]